MASANNRLIGIGSLVVGILVFSTQDAIIKALSGDYAVTQAVVVRCIVAFPILLCFVHLEGGLRQTASRRYRALTLRGLILLVAYTTYYMALAALPLAVAVALFFTAPLFITVLAAVFLREPVGWRAAAAIVIGFAGVLVITAPGFGPFEPAILLSLASACCYAIAMVLARKLGVSEPASVMTFYQNGVYLLGAAMIAALLNGLGLTAAAHPSLDFLIRSWSVPSLIDFGLMALCGVIAAIASSLLTHAYRIAEANLMAVFEYSGMLWAPLWGFLFFAEVPGARVIAGAALIIGAGLLVALKSPAAAAAR
ncbi:MAG: DMT family transporter [Pseudomonadota bacterium]|nr:DMT family transporter [Pseudomonadota bacterium]